jgi:hypothetical protein
VEDHIEDHLVEAGKVVEEKHGEGAIERALEAVERLETENSAKTRKILRKMAENN